MTLHPALLLPLGLFVAIALGTCDAPLSAQSSAARPAPPATQSRTPPRPSPPPLPALPDITLASTAIQQGDLVRATVRPANTPVAVNGALVPVASDGLFLIGVDRDATGDVVVEMRPAGRRAIERRYPVAARQWNVQNINAPARGAARSDADFERRRPGELAQMAAARRTVVRSDGWRQRFIWPVRGRISGVFGSQRVYQGVPGNFHNGVDVAAPTGTPYVAPADGVVILAASESFTLEGYLLMIDHGGGLSSVFLHSSRLDVRTGDVVRQGQRLGAIGATGRTTGPHMHWAMRWNGAKIDAQRVAGPMSAPAATPQNPPANRPRTPATQ
jgi:murein DD-endopeptidase MepM/ murein hydrolase activator NlpD